MSKNKRKLVNSFKIKETDDKSPERKRISHSSTFQKIKQKNEKKNIRSIDNLLILNPNTSNELPPVNNYCNSKENTMSKSQSKYISTLKNQLNELNIELNKMRNDKDIENYQKLENEYLKKNKEMSQLKQDNNLLLFQLEDLTRKYKEKSLNKKNDKNKINLSNPIMKKLQIFKENKQNNLAKIYGVNPNSSLGSNTKNTTRSHFMEGIEITNKNNEILSKLKDELELYKNIDEENKKLKNQIEEKDICVNKYKNKIQTLEFENKNLRNENNKNKEKYAKLFSDFADLEKKNNENEKKHNNLKNQIKNSNKNEKKKLDEFKDDIKEKEIKINELNDNLKIKIKEIEELNKKINDLNNNNKYEELKKEKEGLDKKFEDLTK